MNVPSLVTTFKRARHDFVILTVNNAGKGINKLGFTCRIGDLLKQEAAGWG